MRLDEDGEPLVHQLPKDEHIREARLGLDELLAKGRALVSREKREKAMKTLEDELEATRQRRMKLAQAAAERFEWRPIASLAMFEEQTCANCSTKHTMFRGFGILYQRKAKFEERWQAAPCLDRGLPFQRRVIQSASAVCISCIEEWAAPPDFPPYEFHPERKD